MRRRSCCSPARRPRRSARTRRRSTLASKRARKLGRCARPTSSSNARTSLSTCSASTCPAAVGNFCRQRLAEVVHEIPSIVFAAKDGRGHDLAAVKVSIDGAVFADHLDGTPIELDPGEHVFRFEYAGEEPVVERYVLRRVSRRGARRSSSGRARRLSHRPTVSRCRRRGFRTRSRSPLPASAWPG